MTYCHFLECRGVVPMAYLISTAAALWQSPKQAIGVWMSLEASLVADGND